MLLLITCQVGIREDPFVAQKNQSMDLFGEADHVDFQTRNFFDTRELSRTKIFSFSKFVLFSVDEECLGILYSLHMSLQSNNLKIS